ncbi:MAG: hypothetical protein ING84_14405 [Cytophagales bacterium]|nr:hypothetical protein [Cytophagales bacterium]MCA6365615.1 hypothetical protein [Cytophagales bacterium]MCA6373406.1 hypothetical protein [Cytophagales bacterium]MCA6377747.1 hypothetical protein [Cytophagales bacterium]MCA6383046.1 hypothetical protein [Cytophagales bacterium]
MTNRIFSPHLKGQVRKDCLMLLIFLRKVQAYRRQGFGLIINQLLEHIKRALTEKSVKAFFFAESPVSGTLSKHRRTGAESRGGDAARNEKEIVGCD